MSDKMLTRYKLLNDVHGEVLGVMPRLVHDFCEGYEMVDADDATREIAHRDSEIKRLERERVVVVNDFPNEGDVQYGSEKIASLLDENERLEAQVRGLEGKLPGKLKGERALADEQIRCFLERAEKAEAKLAQAEAQELERVAHILLHARNEHLRYREKCIEAGSPAMAELQKIRAEECGLLAELIRQRPEKTP